MTSWSWSRIVCGLALAMALGGCYDDLKVVQGPVVSADASAKTLTVRDERAPHAETVYQLQGRAAIEPGEVVRLAYRKVGQTRKVVRMMNVTTSEASRAEH